jgi:hypothetical protein
MAPPSYADLATRLPRTFGLALNDQLRRWDLLFPAEQRQLRSQLDYLAGLPQADLKELFAPMSSLESRMDLPNWRPGAAGMSIEETGVLARSPLYPQWRTEVEKVFAHIDEAAETSNRLTRPARLILCVLPPGLPLPTQPVWPDLAGQGSWIDLSKPFRELENALVAALAKRPLIPGLEDIESTWVIECNRDLSTVVESTGAIEFSWGALETIRRTFLNRLNAIHRDLRSADQTTDDLRRLDISQSLDPRLGQIPRVREFIRSILLSGNGSLVFNNSFVQWSASEALRRVQPQVLVACFGIRPKIKQPGHVRGPESLQPDSRSGRPGRLPDRWPDALPVRLLYCAGSAGLSGLSGHASRLRRPLASACRGEQAGSCALLFKRVSAYRRTAFEPRVELAGRMSAGRRRSVRASAVSPIP